MTDTLPRATLFERSRRRQALRLLIKGEEILKFVLDTADKLAKLADDTPQGKWMDNGKVGALRAAADIKMRVLDKVLPDLKSIEHEMGEGLTAMNDEELHARIADLSRRLAERGLLEQSEGEPLRVSAIALRGSETRQ